MNTTRIIFALAAAALVSATGFANAVPSGGQGSQYVGSVEHGVDQAKGNIR